MELPKKKADREALSSPLMQVPRLPVRAVRGLLDLGIRSIFELEGRSPECLWADLRRLQPGTPADLLPYFRLAVYFAEHGTAADARLLHPSAWQDPS